MKKSKIAFLGLTGFGNAILEGLLKIKNINVEFVVTVIFNKSYPYYPLKQLNDFAEENHILVIPIERHENICHKRWIDLFRSSEIDLIIVGTFYHILPAEIFNFPKYGSVNFHPGLLPEFTGKNPIRDVLNSNSKRSGVTAHRITNEIDCGEVLLEKSIYLRENENESSLRKILSELSKSMVETVIRKVIL